MRVRPLVACALALAALASSGCMQAFSTQQSPFVAGSLNQGFYGSGYVFGHDSYEAGTRAHETWNTFFSFDLTDSCEATKVTLELVRGDDETTGTYTLYDVTTPADVLNQPYGDTTDVFIWHWTAAMEDLSSGVSFGEFQVEPATAPTDVVRFRLNQAGLDAFNAAHGGFFSIGGVGNGFNPSVSLPDRFFQDVREPGRLVVNCVIPSSSSD